MDVTLPIIGAVMSLAAAVAGYRAGRKRGVDHTRELNKIGSVLKVRRLRRETDDGYAARLMERMQEPESYRG